MRNGLHKSGFNLIIAREMEKQTNVRAQKSKNGTKITEKMNIGLISCPIIEKRYRMEP